MPRLNSSPRSIKSTRPTITLTDMLWALTGLLLTIAGTLLEASITGVPWTWTPQAVPLHFLGVSYQIGAVLLVGCLGGQNAAVISQIAYLVLGLAGFEIFNDGGGIHYLSKPSFGYLLGFIPGAALCGYLAFKTPPRLESLAFSCFCGLLVIHLTGIFYLFLSYGMKWVNADALSLLDALKTYSLSPLPGQFAVVCAVTVLAFVMRYLMFY